MPEDAAPAVFPCTQLWVNWYMYIQQNRAGISSTTANAQRKAHPCVPVPTPPMGFVCREARDSMVRWIRSKRYKPVLNELFSPEDPGMPVPPRSNHHVGQTQPQQQQQQQIYFTRMWDAKRDVMFIDEDIMFILCQLRSREDDPIWVHMLVLALDTRHIAVAAQDEDPGKLRETLAEVMAVMKNLETVYCVVGDQPQWTAPYSMNLVAKLPDNGISDVVYPRYRTVEIGNEEIDGATGRDCGSKRRKLENGKEETAEEKRKQLRRLGRDGFVKRVCEGLEVGKVKIVAAHVVHSEPA